MQAEFNQSKPVKNLPDAYLKTPKSNNEKILEIEHLECERERESLRSIDAILDLNNATGYTLDLYGERVGQLRGQADDAKYLLMIRAKRMQNLVNGSFPSVIDALCMTFGCEPSQIDIVNDEAPATVKVVSIPIDVIIKAEMTTAQTLALLKSLLPVCVDITSALFDGTFQFSDVENEYDENAGFADVDGGTIGGYLGVTSADAEDVVLPI